jgi:hypothetical protein
MAGDWRVFVASQLTPRATLKATRFIEANQASPLTYMSTDGDGCFYKLVNGQTFDLSTADCVSIRDYEPRWRHLVAA